ncbi:heavy-metal-associated domain-containing protein [Tetragenococcus solitarius]|uniref:HMA domain-containing protein n=1 Tax=Tetragenococcus solitarius TaxID=71453 RepID=A0ABN3Y0Q0_9ENTE|nr:cation transporter [Tetragenococcus solitarius]
MNTNIYLVPDMSCAHCKAKIETEVNKLTGVQEAKANVEDKHLSVIFDPDVVENTAIVNAVSKAGYTAEQA